MFRVAVLGEKESVYVFASLGLDVFDVTDKNNALLSFKKITRSNYAVIYITEQTASLVREEISKFSYRPNPAIILIPGVTGNTGEGIDTVKKSVVKAVGNDFIFTNDLSES